MKAIGLMERRQCGPWLNNRTGKLRPAVPTTRAAIAKFRGIKSLQKFASFHASVHNLFNQDRHLNRRQIFKQSRFAALAEWRQIAA